MFVYYAGDPDYFKMMQQGYRDQMDREAEQERQGFAKTSSSGIIRYESPEVTKYPWGKGVTQRIVTRWWHSQGTEPAIYHISGLNPFSEYSRH